MEENKTQEIKTPPAPAAARVAEMMAADGLSPLRETVGAVVDRWVLDHIHGSPVARSTEAYNHLKDSLPSLKAALVDAVKEA